MSHENCDPKCIFCKPGRLQMDAQFTIYCAAKGGDEDERVGQIPCLKVPKGNFRVVMPASHELEWVLELACINPVFKMLDENQLR